MIVINEATVDEAAYIRDVLIRFREYTPDLWSIETKRNVTRNTLTRLRVWAVINHFRRVNYGWKPEDILDAEFVGD